MYLLTLVRTILLSRCVADKSVSHSGLAIFFSIMIILSWCPFHRRGAKVPFARRMIDARQFICADERLMCQPCEPCFAQEMPISRPRHPSDPSPATGKVMAIAT
jgi:hypothetical protein